MRAKLAAAEAAGPAFARNAEALRNVQPEDVLPGDIDANLGRRGFPNPTSRPSPPTCSTSRRPRSRSAHLPKDAVWSIDADYATQQSVAATSDYGTPRANGTASWSWRST